MIGRNEIQLILRSCCTCPLTIQSLGRLVFVNWSSRTRDCFCRSGGTSFLSILASRAASYAQILHVLLTSFNSQPRGVAIELVTHLVRDHRIYNPITPCRSHPVHNDNNVLTTCTYLDRLTVILNPVRTRCPRTRRSIDESFPI